MKDLIIIGCGGFGREVAWLVDRINQKSPTWNLLGFLDDTDEKQGNIYNGYKVLGYVSDVTKYDAWYVCAIGSSKDRQTVIDRITKMHPSVRFATLIDPGAEISDYVTIGDGTIVCAHSVITVNISIGKHVIINLDCTVGHDAVLQDYVTLYPSTNISGVVNIGCSTEIGTGSQIIQGKNVGSNTIVGAGSVIIRDIPSNCTAVGCPAKPIKFFE